MEQLMTGAEKSAPDFVLRDLKSVDVWQLVRILSKLKVREFGKIIDPEILKASNWKHPTMLDDNGEEVPLPRDMWTEGQIQAELKAELATDEMVWSVLSFIMENIGECEFDVNKLLAMGTGMSIEENRKMDANRYLDLLAAYITRDGFRDFFMHAWTFVRGAANRKKSYGSVMATLTQS